MKVKPFAILRWSAAPCLSLAAAAAQLPPLDEREKNLPPRLLPAVRAEHAFARASVAKGMKEAFLASAADDAVLFRAGPVNAKELWSKADPAPTALLTWFPTYADVSLAGDMAYTTGPWEIRPNPSDKEPAAAGHFVTVWRPQGDGAWKYVADIGIRHAPPPPTLQGIQFPAGVRGKAKSAGGDAEPARRELAAAEERYARDSASLGAGAALLAQAAPDVRLYRQGALPYVGRRAAEGALKGKTERATWQTAKMAVSSSGDLGYSYGTYEIKAAPSDDKPSERGGYLRIWKKQGKAWRVVLDITNPAPASG
ncbi:MAG TPA: nuclear transport factor 2 family protein [Pyrinomonadaceae bacterium]|nr:nuclear transport factor 2 family protein [Pyrinomonadaceae bacterium]